MMRETGIDESVAPILGVVAEASCRYYQEVAFPGPVDVGVRVTRIGLSSVVFGFGLYVPENEEIATHGEWVQVYIDRETRRPVPMPGVVRAHLEGAVARRPVLATDLAGEPA